MQVKVCPKCKAENRPTNAACSSCYTSLENVAVTESAAPPPARTQAVPAAPRPPRPPRPTAPPAPTQQMQAPQQTQMGTLPPPPPGMPPGMQFQVTPVKTGPSGGVIALIIFLFVVIFGGGIYYAVTKSGLLKGEPMPTEPPEKAAIGYLEAKKTHDMSKVEPFLSKRSIELVHKAFSDRQSQSAGFGRKDAEEMHIFGATPTAEEMEGRTITASVMKGDEYSDDRTAVVLVALDRKHDAQPSQPQPLVPPGATPPPQAQQQEEKKVDFSKLFDTGPIEVQYVMVAEDGKWKVDIAQTDSRALGLGKVKNPFKPGK